MTEVVAFSSVAPASVVEVAAIAATSLARISAVVLKLIRLEAFLDEEV